MAFQLSPGVNWSEIDLTTVVPGVATTSGAIAGVFRWGPADEVTQVTSEIDLINRFGKPVVGWNQETFFSAADFLAYATNLNVVRVTANNSAFATTSAGISTYDTANATDYANTDLVEMSAKYTGALGNSLKVVIMSDTSWANSTYTTNFGAAPSSNTNVHMMVIDEDGDITGTSSAIVEKYENISLTVGDQTVDGTANYIDDIFDPEDGRSSYIKIPAATSFASELSTYLTTEGVDFSISLASGDDGDNEATIATGDLQLGYDLFKSDDVDVSLVMAGKARGIVGNHYSDMADYIVQNLCEFRKDCIAFISPDKGDVVNNGTSTEVADVIAFRNAMTSSSYGVLDSGYKKRYDKYNDTYVWTPLNGDVAGLCVRTDNLRDAWWSPAGYNRGIIKNSVKLAFNPNGAQRDSLYVKGVNPVITQSGQGTFLFGDKTLLSTPSAFDRINVRRLFIVLEKAISTAAKSMLFEFNDEFTRASFVNLVEPYLRDVEGRRGIYDFRVVCDETNNTGEIIDRNEFVGDIYIKPARSINFIQLNFVAVRTGVEFEEIVGRF
jgi:hypothetical protein